MRTTFMLLLCLTTADLAAAERMLASPSCEALPAAGLPGGCGNPACSRCNAPCNPPCDRDVPLQPKEGPPPELPYVPREAGNYLAPPRTGTMRGPTSVRGVEGAAITLPELRLKFPSIQLPSCFHGHSQARMMIDSAVAPWESHGIVNAASDRNAAVLQQELARLQERERAAPRAADDRVARDAAEQHLKATQSELDRLRCEVDRLRQLDECIRQYQRNAEQNPSCNRPGDSPTQAPFGNPQPPVPAPDYGARMRAPMPAMPPTAEEQKLHELEQAERRIDQKLALLQASLSKVSGGQPIPPIDNGALHRLQPPGYAPPQPVQPQYVPTQYSPAQYQQPQYVEKPVAYVTEPQPQRLPIREPQPKSPSGRITGLRK